MDGPVHQSVHHFVTEEIVTMHMATVHMDAHRDGSGILVIKYAVQDVRMVYVIKKVGFVLVGAKRTGQGKNVTVSIEIDRSVDINPMEIILPNLSVYIFAFTKETLLK